MNELIELCAASVSTK
ncbi:hypothetical protein CP8484711_1028A, partial [Chlamydia psittaci 84-8471/1]